MQCETGLEAPMPLDAKGFIRRLEGVSYQQLLISPNLHLVGGMTL